MYGGLLKDFPAVLYLDGVGLDETMIDVSPGIEQLLGVTRDDWLTGVLPWTSIIHPLDLQRVLAESDRCVEAGEPFCCEYRAIHADGRVVWIQEEANLVRDDAGEPTYWLGWMRDVTELRRARDELHDATSKYGALVEQIPAIVYQDIADENWTTVYVSPQISALLGVEPSEWTGDSTLWADMLHPADRDRAIEEVDRGIASGEPYTVEYRMLARGGTVRWFQDTAVMLPGPDGNPALIHGVMLDITERKAAEERVAYLAYHDPVTGLPNKAMFDELLELSVARARRHGMGVSVLALDVDEFKLVNDSLGHETGDRLISLLADRLREATRETDLVARSGGDEFRLLIADIEPIPPLREAEAARAIAESVAVRIRDTLTEPFEIDGTELYLTVSIGSSSLPGESTDAGALLRNADTAMFTAKAEGPGSYVHHHSGGRDAPSRLSLATRLRKAVEQRAWVLHYQPLVRLDDARMIGVEALIRWPDGSGGLVPPGDFIPLAERMGLIDEIGEWVVEEIARQDERWRRDDLTLDEISFNLSPRQLWHADPVEGIVARLHDAGMDPRRVTVEMTESAAMHDPDRAVGILHRFKDAGLRIAIDDFGTGYSSLARLRHMPVDVLKIDRSFVREVHDDERSASLVSAVIALASNLGMEALAEGIETDAERRFLAGQGCRLGQGYLFSRPVPAEEILAIHRRSGLRVVDGGVADSA